MKRKTSATPTRIWTFGMRTPSPEDEAAIREQTKLAHRYQNALVEIERERRVLYREARTALSPELAVLETRIGELNLSIENQRRDIKSLRKITRERTLHRSAMATLKLLNTERRAVAIKLKAARGLVNTDSALRTKADAINEAAYAKQRKARSESGLYWGTYLLVEKAMEAVTKGKDDPQFKRYRGGGRAGVQIQNGMTVAELFSGNDTRLRLAPLPSGTWDTRVGRRHAVTQVKIRIGTTADKKPRFAVFDHLVQHRPLPSDGIVKWAWIKLEPIGTRIRWSLQLSLESEEFATRKHASKNAETVAVNLSWRTKPSGDIRAGYAVGTDGRERELLLPAKLRERFTEMREHRSHGDLIFDEAKKCTQAFLAAAPTLDDEVRQAAEHIHAWRSHGKLVRFAKLLGEKFSAPREIGQTLRDWRAEREREQKFLYDSPAPVFDWLRTRGVTGHALQALYLHIWWKANDFLWNQEAELRSRTLGWRKHLYRNYAAELASEYKTLLIEKFDLRSVAEKPEPEEEEAHVSNVAHVRTIAAPSELRLALIAAFHGDHIEQSADHNTLACTVCGAITDDPPARKLVLTCPGCGSEHDQDRNNCQNQLARQTGEYRGPAPRAAE